MCSKTLSRYFIVYCNYIDFTNRTIGFKSLVFILPRNFGQLVDENRIEIRLEKPLANIHYQKCTCLVSGRRRVCSTSSAFTIYHGGVWVYLYVHDFEQRFKTPQYLIKILTFSSNCSLYYFVSFQALLNIKTGVIMVSPGGHLQFLSIWIPLPVAFDSKE